MSESNGVESIDMLAKCEQRAIELYYEADSNTTCGECKKKLVDEFGEETVSVMLKNGIGNNSTVPVKT